MRVESILPTVEFDPGSGALHLGGVRYLLIRPETIIGFQKKVEEAIGREPAGRLFYRGGYEGGSRSARKLMEENGLGPGQTLEAMCAMGTQIGWGSFDLIHCSESSQNFEVAVVSSPWAQAYSTSSSPVCHLVAGVFGGVASVIFDRRPAVVETACAAAGSDRCVIKTVEEEP
jgi:predicted hydrocarbon binding protein